MRGIIERKIQDIDNWMEKVEDYLYNENNLTKKERNYYLSERLTQIEVKRVLEDCLNESEIGNFTVKS